MTKCLFCGTDFRPARRGHLYCSTQCKNAAALARERWRIVGKVRTLSNLSEEEIYSLLWSGPLPPKTTNEKLSFEDLIEMRREKEENLPDNPYLNLE